MPESGESTKERAINKVCIAIASVGAYNRVEETKFESYSDE